MQHLNLSHCLFSGQVPQEISYLSELLTLDLSYDYVKLETSSLQRILANLTNLKELCLRYVVMSSVESHSLLMNLSSCLTSLDLRSSGLRGKFPEKIFLLPNLQALYLSDNKNLTGSFSKSNLSSSIRELALSGTAFSIDMSYLVRNLKFLNALHLSNCKFIGSYPSVIVANLSKISSLDLSDNNFVGQIPWNIFLNLQQLINLDLSYNNFEGQLPQILGHIPVNLEILDLSFNMLNGTIPSWMYYLPLLGKLNLASNQFVDTIQEFHCASLRHLNLEGNKLHGPIPVSVFQQENLSYLDLSGNNLSGVVGLDQFSKLKNLDYLSFSYNNLSLSFNNFDNYTLPNLVFLGLSTCNLSEFPYFLRASESLNSLDLSENKIQGNIPKWLSNVGVDTLAYLSLSHNLLTGYVPEQLPWTTLETLDLRSNMIHGRLPIPPPTILSYFISNNQLSGEIPSLICTLTSIEVLDLSHNTLNGSIPLCLGNHSYLSVLDLRMNMFDGTIPTTFSKGNSLTSIHLNGNRLKGPLSRALLNCRNIEILDLGDNMINDTFPQWLESLPNLQVLILRSNKFRGSISSPSVRFPFQKLRIMDLSNNQFNGVLPTQYFENFLAMMHDGLGEKLKYMGEDLSSNYYYHDSVVVTMKGLEVPFYKILYIFTTIDLSKNNFDGEIPKSIRNLKSLKGLNFSHNKISGHIPASLGNLTNLEWLDLSSNKLSGEIPMQLIEMTWLAVLNFSQNNLVGVIPRGKQFDTFGNDSYVGNLGLGGLPLTKTCGRDKAQQPSPAVNDDEEQATNGFDWKYVFMGYGSGLVIGISVGYMFFSEKRLACFMRKVGGEPWLKLLKRRKSNARFRTRNRRRN
ncbi:hypothetical protein FNV43_RR24957 [Rhamnella rubrinervis]|uniref:Receptor-like protein 12 n=1 Tax=Rhamnella rubrinervis TaxID=2594499 RepID=A0A8K0GPM4_9ROSA|nr:hypothetical protein FNV43_RR24957 [Rhamnella rubrinervis]